MEANLNSASGFRRRIVKENATTWLVSNLGWLLTQQRSHDLVEFARNSFVLPSHARTVARTRESNPLPSKCAFSR
jgi:hypothetical protein